MPEIITFEICITTDQEIEGQEITFSDNEESENEYCIMLLDQLSLASLSLSTIIVTFL